ncbi:BH3-interacting domain death agonist isoform X1 [Sorex araneus]|uniref:BH3-interacting domain death agonist isoform X1 n=1 Tax=Sorex araneus TaxID=42254 RepID=UPI002433C97D|nr:BH3-interacting domain death agonist isoform X1 [Sorex araneus]
MMEMQVRPQGGRGQISNSSGLHDEHITNLLLFGFLQNCSNLNFHEELKLLQCRLARPQGLELQTDGNHCSHLLVDAETDSESQEEIIQDIARQLAHIGDSMDCKIHPALVQDLAARFINGNLSEEEREKCLGEALSEILRTYPKDMEQEKIVLTMTMLLAKKVANHTPSLLRDVFHTTVNFIISQNLLSCVRNLVGNDID